MTSCHQLVLKLYKAVKVVKESKSVTVWPQRLSDANMHVAQTESERPASLPLQTSLGAYCSPPSTPQTCGSTQNQPQQPENRLAKPARAHPDPHRPDSGDGGSLREERVWHVGQETVETDGRCRQGHSGDDRLRQQRANHRRLSKVVKQASRALNSAPCTPARWWMREGCWLS